MVHRDAVSLIFAPICSNISASAVIFIYPNVNRSVFGLTHDIPCCEQCSKLVLLDDCGYCGLYYHVLSCIIIIIIIIICIYYACIHIVHEVSFPKLVLLDYIYIYIYYHHYHHPTGNPQYWLMIFNVGQSINHPDLFINTQKSIDQKKSISSIHYIYMNRLYCGWWSYYPDYPTDWDSFTTGNGHEWTVGTSPRSDKARLQRAVLGMSRCPASAHLTRPHLHGYHTHHAK